MPTTSTAIVRRPQPFHSFSSMPQTLEKTTSSAISMQNENVISTGESVRKPLPRANPKNWLYHNAPAKRQKRMLLAHTLRLP